ncbi:MAG: D-aminoacyl-tRNA deacylase [Anaerotardibacter sp.]
MRALIQRVDSASVSIEGEDPHAIDKGYVILLGVGHEDTQAIAQKLWEKIYKLRIFEDQDGKTNLSLKDVGGSVLLVSQFTLYADCKKGNRPSFTKAGSPDAACELYEYFADLIRQSGVTVQTGWFGEMMKVSLVNDGPFTIWLDTESMGWQ